jgi:hypothetical protein
MYNAGYFPLDSCPAGEQIEIDHALQGSQQIPSDCGGAALGSRQPTCRRNSGRYT